MVESKLLLPMLYDAIWGELTRIMLPDSLPLSLVVGKSTSSVLGFCFSFSLVFFFLFFLAGGGEPSKIIAHPKSHFPLVFSLLWVSLTTLPVHTVSQVVFPKCDGRIVAECKKVSNPCGIQSKGLLSVSKASEDVVASPTVICLLYFISQLDLNRGEK